MENSGWEAGVWEGRAAWAEESIETSGSAAAAEVEKAAAALWEASCFAFGCSALRAAFFFLRRTFRSWVSEEPLPGGTGGWEEGIGVRRTGKVGLDCLSG
jgi:hypothetical protein